nr:MAG TPA: hypothetical protein [Caudoviricetes sp.]DAR83167.1 MAG TPA: hypothetical protein [Caudoviricetes sp.]DAY87711.1 MAG TPA: hypothetical protein [Caudoviricetes sp.]
MKYIKEFFIVIIAICVLIYSYSKYHRFFAADWIILILLLILFIIFLKNRR